MESRSSYQALYISLKFLSKFTSFNSSLSCKQKKVALLSCRLAPLLLNIHIFSKLLNSSTSMYYRRGDRNICTTTWRVILHLGQNIAFNSLWVSAYFRCQKQLLYWFIILGRSEWTNWQHGKYRQELQLKCLITKPSKLQQYIFNATARFRQMPSSRPSWADKNA